MLCKLLALKANHKNADPEKLIREIYQALTQIQDKLSEDQRLLIDQWIHHYKKIPNMLHDNIKEEFQMSFVATTISEYFFHEGEIKGEIKDEIKCEIKGEIKGKINTLETLYHEGFLPANEYETRIKSLRCELDKALAV